LACGPIIALISGAPLEIGLPGGPASEGIRLQEELHLNIYKIFGGSNYRRDMELHLKEIGVAGPMELHYKG